MADDRTSRLPRFPFGRGNVSPGASSRGSESDPLNELARLIGHTDGFAAPPASARTSRASDGYRQNAYQPHEYPPDDYGDGDGDWPGSPASPPAGHDQAPPYEPAYHHEPEPYYAQEPAPPHAAEYAQSPAFDDGYAEPAEYGETAHDGPYYGDNGQLLADDAYAAEQYDAVEPPPRRRSGLITVAAVVGLAALGTAGAYGYRTIFSRSAPSAPPLIKAEAGPNKVVPAQNADTSAKQIYDRLGSSGPTGEQIVSREEQPVDVKPANTGPVYQAAPSTGGRPAANQLPTGWPSPAGTAQANAGPAALSEPRKVKTIPIRPDQPPQAQQNAQQSSPQPAPATRAAAPAPQATAPMSLSQPTASAAPAAPAAPAAAPVRTQSVASGGGGPLSLTPQAVGRERVASANVPVRTVPAQTSSGGGYVVQLSAQKTEEEASAAFRAAQARYPNVLNGRRLILRRKEIAGKGTFYGVQVGPFASREDANQLCDQLKSAGGTCLIQKN